MRSIILYAKINSIVGVPPTRLENSCNSVRHARNMLVDISSISQAARTVALRLSIVIRGCDSAHMIFFSLCQTGSMGERFGKFCLLV